MSARPPRRPSANTGRAAAAPDDEVAETATVSLEAERVRRCLDGLTDLQRESITLAYYGGYTYPEVAGLLHDPLGTVKTRSAMA